MLSILILVGVGLMIWMLLVDHGGGAIKVRVDVDIAVEAGINDVVIVPGYKNEYHLKVTADKPDEYDLTFSFVEQGNTANALKDNLYILIEHDGVVYCDAKLSELYEGGPTMPLQLKRLVAQDVKVIYYIPEEVGNEIKGDEIDFGLFITAREK